MKEFAEEEALDIEMQSGGNPWVELVDVVIPTSYNSGLTDAEKAFMNLDPNGVYHILMTNAQKICLLPTAGWSYQVSGGNRVFIAVPYKRDDVEETDSDYGEVATTISLGDTGHYLKSLMEKFDGMVGFRVTLSQSMVDPDGTASDAPYRRTDYLVVRDPSTELYFEVGTVSHNKTYFSLTLESAFPMEWRYPYRTIIKASCQWRFKSPECGYAGADETCDHTIADCRAKGNIVRFGAFPGCGAGGLNQ